MKYHTAQDYDELKKEVQQLALRLKELNELVETALRPLEASLDKNLIELRNIIEQNKTLLSKHKGNG